MFDSQYAMDFYRWSHQIATFLATIFNFCTNSFLKLRPCQLIRDRPKHGKNDPCLPVQHGHGANARSFYDLDFFAQNISALVCVSSTCWRYKQNIVLPTMRRGISVGTAVGKKYSPLYNSENRKINIYIFITRFLLFILS